MGRTVLSPCHTDGSVSTRVGGGRVELSGLLYASLISPREICPLRSWNRLRISLVVTSPLLLKI